MLTAGLNRIPNHLRGGSKHVFIFLLFLSSIAFTRAAAQTVTLAMAVTAPAPTTFQPTRPIAKSSANIPAPAKAPAAAPASNLSAAAPSLRLDKPEGPGGDSLVLARANLRLESKLDSLNLHAGFGHPSDNALAADTDFQLANRNSPGIAYLNASFSF